MELKVNIIAVLVTVVVNFFIGAIWFMPLFGKLWGKEMGMNPDMKPSQGTMIKGMVFMVRGFSFTLDNK